MSALLVASVAAGLAVACSFPARPGGGPVSPAAMTALCVGALPVVLLLVGPRPVAEQAGAWLGPVALLVSAGGIVLWLRGRAGVRRARRERATEVLEVCEELAGDLTAGAAPGAALQRAAVRWPWLAPAASAQCFGTSVPGAWRALAGDPGAGDLRVVAAAWEVAERTGAGLSDALTTVAAGLRDQQRTRRVVASELASARATARLMAVLPVLTLAVGSGAGDPVAFLLGTPAGLACAAAGLALALAGVAWIESIAASLESDAAGRGGGP